ncbi:hypothetical protein C0J50_19267 [Silurus asotus]|uniref:Ig-like domain-containing protein n=1 Tax=Silurus asotus TaxID=30991 RepID=A0AAD5ARZ2_SILAS|nr:hypothetical protein C0J50_19267 [Silurus asotus]
MVLPQPQVWQFLLLLGIGGVLQTDFCVGQQSVQIQNGPLYRAKGFPMSISCNVSDLKFSRKQEFAFLIYKPEKPTIQIQIISTNDKNYAYAMYSQRVREKSINIERLSDTSVLFHIMSPKAEDSGKYECFTPNAGTTYHGSYSAETTLHVIEDTLKASNIGLLSHSISEGESLQLECQVSSQTFQHTHLSVTWYVRGSTDTRPIISLDRDLTVKPGPEFDDRYHSGLISMEKIEDSIYRLEINQVQQSDSGEIYCQADEWIQDPDRSWFRICHRNTSVFNIEVKALDTADEVGSFASQIRVGNAALEEGDMIEIECIIEALNLPGQFFSMTWLKNNSEVAQIGPSGVLSVANTYAKRATEGELRTVKKGDRNFVLTIQPVRAKDQGIYQCKSVQEIKTETGSFIKEKSQLSREETVLIRAKESGLAVVMTKELVNVTEGEPLQITCSVSGAKGLLSVVWQHKKSTSSSFSDVITLSREGVMEAVGAQYQNRGLRTFRSNIANFILELSGALLSDSGHYMCIVFEWSMENNGNLKKVNSNSQQGQVSVKSIDSLVQVSLRSRDVIVTENSVIKMICLVKAPNIFLAVTWRFVKPNSTVPKDIICMDQTGGISCGAEQRDYQLETQVGNTDKTFILKVLRASQQHEGRYDCQIDAYDKKNVQKAKKLSNPLAVTVRRPVSKLVVSTTIKSPLKIQVNIDRVIDCLVTSDTSNSSRFEVTWMHDRQTLVKMEPGGVLHLDMDERISMRRTNRQTFQLKIKQLKPTDSGRYHCSVTEWIQDPDGIWYNLDTKSVTVELDVIAKESRLQVYKANHVHNVSELQTGFEVECKITSRSSNKSVFEVTWSRRQGNERPLIIFNASRDGTLHSTILGRTLVYNRPRTTLYTLTVPNVDSSDNGQYQCQVVEWLQTAANIWRKVAEDKSGELSINVEVEIKTSEGTFTLETPDTHQNYTEGEKLETSCSINMDKMDLTFHYSFTWIVERQGSSASTILLSHTYNGYLKYQTENQQFSGRLLFSRPTHKTFYLTILNLDPSDSGNYLCQVEQYQLGCEGKWEKRGSAQKVSTMVAVHKIESKLQVHKASQFLNVSDPQTGFKVECKITSQSSDKSVFEVTWSRRREDEQPLIIFNASRDGIVHSTILNRTLVYNRPRTTHYTLTVPNVAPSDNGQYQCQVVEWLQTAANTWRKVAEDKSGEFSVYVHDKVLFESVKDVTIPLTESNGLKECRWNGGQVEATRVFQKADHSQSFLNPFLSSSGQKCINGSRNTTNSNPLLPIYILLLDKSAVHLKRHGKERRGDERKRAVKDKKNAAKRSASLFLSGFVAGSTQLGSVVEKHALGVWAGFKWKHHPGGGWFSYCFSCCVRKQARGTEFSLTAQTPRLRVRSCCAQSKVEPFASAGPPAHDTAFTQLSNIPPSCKDHSGSGYTTRM